MQLQLLLCLSQKVSIKFVFSKSRITILIKRLLKYVLHLFLNVTIPHSPASRQVQRLARNKLIKLSIKLHQWLEQKYYIDWWVNVNIEYYCLILIETLCSRSLNPVARQKVFNMAGKQIILFSPIVLKAADEHSQAQTFNE